MNGGVGDGLVQLLRSTEEEALLVAPFMKVGAAERALRVLHDSVTLRCYTRWRPEEVAAGVSDLEVADLLERRGNSRMFLVADLHGKIYCSEQTCIVTSANLTDSALGWRSPANLEIAIVVPRGDPTIRSFELSLARQAVAVTPEIRRAVQLAAAALSQRTPSRDPPEHHRDLLVGTTMQVGSWIPSCLVPSSLYDLYRGCDLNVSSEAADDGYRDLEVLALPLDLSESEFNLLIRSILLQHPSISIIIARAMKEPVFREDVERYFEDLLGVYLESPAEAFRISASWMAYFFSESLEFHEEQGREVLTSRRL